MRYGRLLAASLALAVAPGCNRGHESTKATTLGQGEIARVGETGFSESLVTAVARDRQVSPRGAIEFLAQDALLWQAGHDQSLDHDPHVRWACTAALASRLAGQLEDEARALGRPAEDELATLTVVHAAVLRSTILADENGLAIARAIERAVRDSSSGDDFEKRASAVPHAGARVVVERIADFGPDGRLPDGSALDSKFVTAAFALRLPSETSPIVQTSFGWHVLRLIDRKAPGAVSSSRREDLVNAVMALRARARADAVIRAREHREPVEVMGSADALMASVLAEPRRIE
jgi:hypothetical protein